MFTLRDQVFPREAGAAAAVSAPTYQRDIGGVCDELNDNDSFQARDEKAIEKRLQRVKTTIAQRNALVDGVRRTAWRSAHALAAFTALEPPAAFAAVRYDTETAWNRHLARMRDYAMMLDRASTRAQLVAALDHLVSLRPAYARDSDKLRSGLERLGDASCDLEPHIVSGTFTLPKLDTDKRAANAPQQTARPTRPQTGRPRPRPRHRARSAGEPAAPDGDRAAPGGPAREPATGPKLAVAAGVGPAQGGPAANQPPAPVVP